MTAQGDNEVTVKERMSKNPITVAPDVAVDKALDLMRKHDVRHLPVVEQGQLVGLVNDIELRTAWFASLLEEVTVSDVMVSDPMTIPASASVFKAARLLYHHKLTGLLVEENGSLVGIITLADILKLFVEVLGLLGDSNRLDISLAEGPNSLEEVHGIIGSCGGQVVSVALLSSDIPRRVYSFRLEGVDVLPIKTALEKAGHEVME